MKTITVVVPTYNEEGNIINLYHRTKKVFAEQLPDYICNIQFIDNASKDGTRKLIRELCRKDKTVTAIFNATNFGFTRSQFYGLAQATGDCAVMMCADMQDPPEVIPQFVHEWEQGYKIVVGIKNKSRENPLFYFGRNCYYKLIHRIAEIDHINQFDGFGLYDKEFIRVLHDLRDPLPYLRGIVSELGFPRKEITYTQDKRVAGKSKGRGFFNLYDFSLLGITSYSKIIMHLCTIIGAIVSGCSMVLAVVVVLKKLLNWDAYDAGMAATQTGIFMLGSLQLFFIGFIGEYVVNMNIRIMQHPLVVEEERLNLPLTQAEEKGKEAEAEDQKELATVE